MRIFFIWNVHDSQFLCMSYDKLPRLKFKYLYLSLMYFLIYLLLNFPSVLILPEIQF
uniref:Uncharacterized protein n=1 Tax=Physcomitrium patens TaxID=3218 RepID=A0A2K1JGY2_PHYPA|nr:hypothetical protein PHYPA_018210 [Physcomitrium patens]